MFFTLIIIQIIIYALYFDLWHFVGKITYIMYLHIDYYVSSHQYCQKNQIRHIKWNFHTWKKFWLEGWLGPRFFFKFSLIHFAGLLHLKVITVYRRKVPKEGWNRSLKILYVFSTELSIYTFVKTSNLIWDWAWVNGNIFYCALEIVKLFRVILSKTKECLNERSRTWNVWKKHIIGNRKLIIKI